MAMFDFLTKKKPQGPPTPAGAPPGTPGMPPQQGPVPGTPVDYVRDMRAQGYSDMQIVQALRSQNYPEEMINDAMNQAGMRGGAPTQASTPSPASQQEYEPKSDEGFEEVAEAIVQEKWKEVQEELEKWKEKEDKLTTEISSLKQELKDVKDDLNNLHKAIVSKISDYDQNLLSVGTEIKAMEKVFQNILPELTKNVSDLSRITKQAKK